MARKRLLHCQWALRGEIIDNLHDEEPAKEAPVAAAIDGRRIFAGVLGAPLESQGLDLVFAVFFGPVTTEAQARVALLALAFRALFPAPQLLLLLVAVLLLLVIVLVILHVAIVFLVSFETGLLLVAYKFDDGSLVAAFLLVLEGEATAVEDCSYAFAAQVRVGLGVAEKLELGVD
jgi:hypothetical protein